MTLRIEGPPEEGRKWNKSRTQAIRRGLDQSIHGFDSRCPLSQDQRKASQSFGDKLRSQRMRILLPIL